MNKNKIMAGLLGLALTAAAAQAAAPSLSYKINGNEFIITYTGTLYQSTDAVSWTAVASASSPYKVQIGNNQQFFCAKASDEPIDPLSPGKNGTISLPGGVPLDFVWIKPGTFMMGSPEDELGRRYDEKQHLVALTQGYWLGKYEVTQAQYEAVMGTNPSKWKGTDLPVECVSWNDATNFCAKLTAIERAAGRLPEGYEYTLPTEAQWEYACRAGTTTALNSGKNLSDERQCPEMDEVGWYWYNGGKENDENDLTCTHPVGQKQPNAWGLYDMHGNVFEWCLDWYGAYPASSVTDPTGASTGSNRVIRGGSWDNTANSCRSARRNIGAPSYAFSQNGFRVALAPAPVPESKDVIIPLAEDVNLRMNWIEPGTFIMGSPEDELGAGGDETQHQVTLTQGYWLGRYEVTQAQYEAVIGENPSRFKGADLPVEMVSWVDATNFCARLTEIEKAAGRLPEGYEYTLPTEAQWEYACRAGTTTAFNNGTNIETEEQIEGECPNLDPVGWYWCNSGEKTHPVGQKKPNAWGLYDMHGNVWEWCLDAKGRYPATPVVDPVGENTEPYYAVRGGSYSYYDDGAKKCRSAERDTRLNTATSNSLGFRVALARTKNVTIPLAEDVDLRMIWIHPGTFWMGSPEDELCRADNEMRHPVILTQGYWLGQYEVTQAQYEAVMGTNPSDFKGADRPVECVSWNDAMDFCAKLTEIEKTAGRLPEGYEYTLPTEAQWEYACRAGTTTAFNNGTDIETDDQIYGECPNLDPLAWYRHNSDALTHRVGQKQPNAWGLYDMHGNVAEWCLDWYGEYPEDLITDPTGPAAGDLRVMRGGSWASSAGDCRSAYRYWGAPGDSLSYAGFRVALAPVPESKDMTIPLAENVDLRMNWIEPGTFTMGSPSGELGRYDADETRHQVTLTQGYWLGKYEVTQKQYKAVMGTNPSYFIRNDLTDLTSRDGGLPVEQVSWNDAMEFCKKLTAREQAAGRLPEGYEYTLPTEAQWEYACRAGTTTAFNNGTNIETKEQIKGECPNLDKVGWYDANGFYMTHLVGQKRPPNAWGLCDMHGNVFEWCLDRYGDYPTSAVTDPTGPVTGDFHVIRGGSWASSAGDCRSAYRFSYMFDYRNFHLGFRVALAPVK
ncbi:MAG: formylglycine-generating enzyme family protein [Verrucomicrobia bacterium]|nr:formylglycine-generating enzyme family protein [Verrucomicrobiota bacterium]